MLGLFSFVGFTLLVAVIAYLATRKTDEKTSDGYFLGGRSLTAGVIAGSLLLTNLSTEQLVGLNGSAYKDGLSVMAWETLAAIAMVVTAIFLLPRYLKSGLTTVPQFLADRFDVTTKTFTSVLFLSGYVIVLLPVILYSGAVPLKGMFDVPTLLGVSDSAAVTICIWGIGIIGSIYAVFGGLKAVAVSDSINAIGLIIGGILIPVFGLMAIGDGNMFTGLENLYNADPDLHELVYVGGGPIIIDPIEVEMSAFNHHNATPPAAPTPNPPAPPSLGEADADESGSCGGGSAFGFLILLIALSGLRWQRVIRL